MHRYFNRERVIVTAAHCLQPFPATPEPIEFDYQGEAYTGRCTASPVFLDGSARIDDIALCALDRAVPTPIAESVNFDVDRVIKGKYLTLLGYGCAEAGLPTGVLRKGEVAVCTKGTPMESPFVATDGPTVCLGDSGGPGFSVDSSSKRYLVGIIKMRGELRRSYLSPLYFEKTHGFFSSWSHKNGVSICGLHEDARGCR